MFSVLGFMAKTLNVKVGEVVTSGEDNYSASKFKGRILSWTLNRNRRLRRIPLKVKKLFTKNLFTAY